MKTNVIVLVVLAGVFLAGCGEVNVNSPNGNEASRPANASSSSASANSASAGGGGWADLAAEVAGGIFLGTEKGVLFYAFDTLAYPGEPVDLAVKVQSGDRLSNVEGVNIGFYREGNLVGRAKTGANGIATLSFTPPSAGDYRFEARIDGVPQEALSAFLEASPAPLLVCARPKDSQMVVIDLDYTVVGSSFFRVLTFGAQPMPGSLDATKRIAERYTIIYLTHRPDLLTVKSKNWLQDQGYPAGPLLVSELKDAFGDSGKFKTARLGLISQSYPNLKIGIGDKISDVQSYVRHGMTAYLIPHYNPEKPKEMRQLAAQIRQLSASGGRLNVVDNWEQIERGIFEGAKFPPDTYAQRLLGDAQQLEAAQRNRDRDDDDDD